MPFAAGTFGSRYIRGACLDSAGFNAMLRWTLNYEPEYHHAEIARHHHIVPGTHFYMSPAQARASRAILRLKVADAAARADIAPNTLLRIEAGKSVNTASIKAVRGAYEAEGVRFTAEGCVCPPAEEAGAGATP